MFGTKNDHFLKLCHEGQLGPPASKLSAICATREVENTPKCTRLTVSLRHDSARPCHPKGGFGLVPFKNFRAILNHTLKKSLNMQQIYVDNGQLNSRDHLDG